MKILTSKQQKAIIDKLVANAIIFDDGNDKIENIDHFVENTIDMAYTIGGMEGVAALERRKGKR